MDRRASILCVVLASAVAADAFGQLAARTTPAVAATTEVQPQEPPLVADGYCVVTLRDQQAWAAGDVRVGLLFDGRRYLFASPRERDIFLAAPTSYAPVLSGDCAVAFAETGKRLPGSVKFAAVQGGRVYLLSSEEA